VAGEIYQWVASYADWFIMACVLISEMLLGLEKVKYRLYAWYVAISLLLTIIKFLPHRLHFSVEYKTSDMSFLLKKSIMFPMWFDFVLYD